MISETTLPWFQAAIFIGSIRTSTDGSPFSQTDLQDAITDFKADHGDYPVRLTRTTYLGDGEEGWEIGLLHLGRHEHWSQTDVRHYAVALGRSLLERLDQLEVHVALPPTETVMLVRGSTSMTVSALYT